MRTGPVRRSLCLFFLEVVRNEDLGESFVLYGDDDDDVVSGLFNTPETRGEKRISFWLLLWSSRSVFFIIIVIVLGRPRGPYCVIVMRFLLAIRATFRYVRNTTDL